MACLVIRSGANHVLTPWRKERDAHVMRMGMPALSRTHWPRQREAQRSTSGLACAYSCAYDSAVAEYEWDPAKAAANLARHDVDFADAVGVLEDDSALTIEDASTEEERFKTLGMDFLGRVLVVVYTYRDERFRVISARKATAPQRDLYDRKRR